MSKDVNIRYSDSDLAKFKKLINEKIDKAKHDLELIKSAYMNDHNNGTEDTSPTFKAFDDTSKAVTWHLGLSIDKEIIIQPEPVPISNIFFDSFFFIIFKISSTKCSVSGLGIKTDLFTKNLCFQNSFEPKI